MGNRAWIPLTISVVGVFALATLLAETAAADPANAVTIAGDGSGICSHSTGPDIFAAIPFSNNGKKPLTVREAGVRDLDGFDEVHVWIVPVSTTATEASHEHAISIWDAAPDLPGWPVREDAVGAVIKPGGDYLIVEHLTRSPGTLSPAPRARGLELRFDGAQAASSIVIGFTADGTCV